MLHFSFPILLSRQNKVKYSKNVYPIKTSQNKINWVLAMKNNKHSAHLKLSISNKFCIALKKITSYKMSYDIYQIGPKRSCVIYMTFLLKIEFLYFTFCHKLHRPVIFKLCFAKCACLWSGHERISKVRKEVEASQKKKKRPSPQTEQLCISLFSTLHFCIRVLWRKDSWLKKKNVCLITDINK